MKIPRVRHRPWKPSVNSPWREPRPYGWFPAAVEALGGFYIRWGLGLDRVTLRRPEVLAQAMTRARHQGDRLIVVFRHCGDADPQGLWYALNRATKQRFLFLAGAEIALWGGPLAALALRATGALSLAHGIGSRPALDYLRNHFRESFDPVVLAPEGQITYELRGPIVLDPGAANMALWAAEASATEARVLPLGIRYRCPRETWARWETFVRDLEKGVGLAVWSDSEGTEVSAGRRLLRLWDHLLETAETYYRKKHRRELPDLDTRDARCRRLYRTAIELAAAVRGFPVGDYRAALFHLRSSAMDLVFPWKRDPSTLGGRLETRGAAEGWWINRHQDLADILQCLNPDALPDQPDLERAVEAALNLADLAGRLAGGTLADRPRYFRRVMEITVGDPWGVGKADGRTYRARAAEVTEAIRTSFERLARTE